MVIAGHNSEPKEKELEADKEPVLVQEQDDKTLELDKISEKEMLMMFMKEMKSTMIEMFKHVQPVNNTTTSNNIHNNSIKFIHILFGFNMNIQTFIKPGMDLPPLFQG
jgi:hypothetical protein